MEGDQEMKRGEKRCSLETPEGSFVGTYLGDSHGQMQGRGCCLSPHTEHRSGYPVEKGATNRN